MNRVTKMTGNPLHSSVARQSWWCRLRPLKPRAAFFSLLLVGMSQSPALTEDDFLPYQQLVTYDNNRISIALRNIRAGDAAQLMSSTAGVTITLPAAAQSKTINLALEGAKMDQAVSTLLATLELNNSFLIYDRDGQLRGVVALEPAPSQPLDESQPPEEDRKTPKYVDLTAAEREGLLRDFRLWSKLSEKDRESIHARLRTIPPSKDRDKVISEYVRLVLGTPEAEPAANE